jgi:hypothetical protein
MCLTVNTSNTGMEEIAKREIFQDEAGWLVSTLGVFTGASFDDAADEVDRFFNVHMGEEEGEEDHSFYCDCWDCRDEREAAREEFEAELLETRIRENADYRVRVERAMRV